jgi:hypothetical protein
MLTFYTILRQVHKSNSYGTASGDGVRYSELEIEIEIARQTILLGWPDWHQLQPN